MSFTRRLAVLALASLAVAGVSGLAQAQNCSGVVRGLSSTYDPSTGSGFLAVRAGPNRSATQIGELFNGDRVGVYDKRGSWYQIEAPGIGTGWAHGRWIRNSCGW